MRSILIRTQPAEHVLVLTLHHVVTDNWPQTVLYRELGALYAAFSRGATSPLAELPLQYGDYAVWQRRWIQGEVLESRLSYWRKQFADWTRLVLPTDHPPVEASTIQRMLSQWRSLLERVVVSPDEPITSFALASAETSSSLPDPSVHLPELPMEPAPRVFESWAERQPERTALRQGNRRYSYGELHQGATTLARRLVAGRSTRGEVVAVTGPRSFGFIESALGVLLSGRVLVTLDRRLPAERQRLMLREAAAARIVYVGEPRPEDQWIWELSLPATEVPRHGGAADDKSVPQADLPALQGDDEAYVFFTSGTTGVPKGVLGCHKGLSHFLKWQREAFGVGPDDRCSHLTSVSFDVVLREIFLPLTSGGTLCLVDDEADVAASAILAWLAEEEIAIVHTVPTLAQAWLSADTSDDDIRSVRCVFFAGEPLQGRLANRWRAKFPGTKQVVNLYGPTETTLAKCFYVVPDHLIDGIQPVGKPLPQSQALVWDRAHHACAIGEPGEIVIRTPYRTLGYINAPEENDLRFVKNPYRDDEKDVVYFTGDRGRYRADGNLEILGRLDEQVKIRGARVELGEVASALVSHPTVLDSAVVAQDQDDEKRLIAYVVLEAGEASVARTLRDYLKQKLPEYMVPSAFVVMDSLPLTPSGKVDRKALPAPESARRELSERLRLPRTAHEETLAGVWKEVLSVDEVGIDDNFFELGGHSLLATQVMSRVRQTFEVELPLRNLFESPTIRELAEHIEEAMLEEQAPKPPPLVARTRPSRIPLSFAQQRLWFLDQLAPGTTAYNMAYVYRLEGELNVEALAAAFEEIARRHEVLRTTFPSLSGQPYQSIAPSSVTTGLPLVDLSELAETERRHETSRLIKEHRERAYDLSKGPLYRACLVRVGTEEDEHILLLSFHHIISDGWTMGVFHRELSTLYDAFERGEPSPLPELRLQYADFALWQRDWLRGDVLEAQLDYWRKQLAELPVLAFPTDRPRPTLQSYRGAFQRFSFDTERTASLKKLSLDSGASLFHTLLAVFMVLLHRYTGRHDIVLGTPIAGRTQKAIEPLIGFFVNSLVLRGDLSGNPSFRELLGRVREMALEAYAHQDLPFEKLVEELKPQRDTSRHPLFQISFALQNAPESEVSFTRLAATKLDTEDENVRFDLELHLQETAGALDGLLIYNTDLFDTATAMRWTRHLENLVKGICAKPGAHLSELPLLSSWERHQLLIDWGCSQTKRASRAECLHQFFEAQVERSPNAVALVWGESKWSYKELNGRANQLARHLRGLGVRSESTVGLYLDHSVEAVVAVLGVLKAGGAYVPLSVKDPMERTAWQMKDAKLSALVTRKKWRESLPIHEALVVDLDSEEEVLALECAKNLHGGAEADNAAYVLYTSGSTGRPKGVVVPHRAVVNYLDWAIGCYAAKGNGSPLLSSLCFDLSLTSLFYPLAVGQRLTLSDEREDIERLSEALDDDSEFSLVKLTPTHLELVRRMAQERVVSNWSNWTKTLVLGGEPLYGEQLAFWRERAPQTRLINEYGPTETTVGCTAYEVPQNAILTGPIAIGRPIANAQIYVLDEELQPVPIGVTGELYVGGAGLARGYWNRAELTAEKFLPHPFSEEPGERMYRTGDLARYRPDGMLEYLGRRDHQVKLRGYRIELGEIEATLRRDAAVEDAVVSLEQPESSDAARIVAHVVGDETSSMASPKDDWENERISQWKSLYEELYQHPDGTDPEFNTVGWSSSYTGEPIGLEEMREWVDETVKRIVSMRPERVFEIGCGTGLLLWRVAPRCQRYLGSDFSRPVVEALTKEVNASSPKLSQVSLECRLADEFEGLERGEFDTVILNSVVQYFPSIEYLVRVLKGAVALTSEGGSVFIGDVRSLPLVETFYASVEVHQADETLGLSELRERVRRRRVREEELVIDPVFFRALREEIPRVGRVSIQPKRGVYTNELTRFRYDVMLHLDDAVSVDAAMTCLDWRREGLTLQSLRRYLERTEPETLEIRNVANGRLSRENRIVEMVSNPDGIETVGELRAIVEECADEGEVEFQQVEALAEELCYAIEPSWASGRADGSFEVVFSRRSDGPIGFSPEPARAARAWSFYANSPLRDKLAQQLVPHLKSYLQEHLPEYMVPSAFVVMDSLPLTPSGKVDRSQLPPAGHPSVMRDGSVTPRTLVESILVETWSELLGTEPIGVRDDFFELGGHSLLVVRLMARIEQRFGLRLPVATLFTESTVEALAMIIEEGPPPQRANLVTIQAGSGKSPLFCVHAAGGTVFSYLDLARHLGSEQPIYGLQASGVGGEEPVDEAISVMATRYLKQVLSIQPKGPYALIGWSMGGLVAFEMAHQLIASGETIAFLGLLDTTSRASASFTDTEETQSLAAFAKHLGVDPETLSSADRFGSNVATQLGWLHGLFQNNVRAAKHYSPAHYPGKITLFRPTDSNTDDDGRLGWADLAGEVELFLVPGNHFTMVREPHVRELAASFGQQLRNSRKNPS